MSVVLQQQELPTFPIARTDMLLPPAEYAEFRVQGPTRVRMWDGREAWLFTRNADVRAMLSSPHFSADPTKPGYPFLTPARAATVKSYQTFITMDPPDHTKFRRMLTKDFTQKRMEELRPAIEKYVDGLIDDMVAHGSPVDLVKYLALKLPVTVVSMLVGVPYEDHGKLVKWSNDRLDLSLPPEVSQEAYKLMFQYFDAVIARKEENPGDGSDMVGRLVLEQIRPGNCSRMDAIHMILLLYFAGHETTANQIGMGVLNFLMNDDQKQKLLANPTLVKNAVEEMLRLDTPTHYNACRACTADVEIGGQQIRAGEGAYALLIGANWDPAVFPQPETFDIERSNASAQMTFSYGLHQCIGQPLARLELETVFRKLFQRLPTLQLAVSFSDIPFKREMYVYGLNALPVKW
ncbi:MAG TPA: cytochrome P450 [Ramlibacter sp.]|nr:cytochrome P450 [Ramlibacter sp.]